MGTEQVNVLTDRWKTYSINYTIAMLFRKLGPSLVAYFESWSCFSEDDGSAWRGRPLIAN